MMLYVILSYYPIHLYIHIHINILHTLILIGDDHAPWTGNLQNPVMVMCNLCGTWNRSGEDRHFTKSPPWWCLRRLALIDFMEMWILWTVGRKLYETVAYFLGRILESLIFAAVKSLIRKDLEQESSMSYSLCRTWQLAGQLTGRAFWRIMWQSFGKLCLPNGYYMLLVVSKHRWSGAEISFFEAVWNRQIHCMTTVFAMFPTPGQTAANRTNVWLTSRAGAWQLTEWAWCQCIERQPLVTNTLRVGSPWIRGCFVAKKGQSAIDDTLNKHVWAFQFLPGPLNWVLPCRCALSLGAGSTRKNSFWTREEFVLQRCNLSIWFLVEVKHIALPTVSDPVVKILLVFDSAGTMLLADHISQMGGWWAPASPQILFFSVLCSLEWLGLSQLLVSSRLRVVVEFQSQHLRETWSCSRMDN